MAFNILANFIAKVWNILALIVFTPMYVRELGLKSYSIISLAIVFQGVISIADAGLTPLVTRDLASDKQSSLEKKQVLNSFELIYFFLVTGILILLFIFS